jgi:hypothetical protein
MAPNTSHSARRRPEPGIATDEELREAVQAVERAVPDRLTANDGETAPIYAERFARRRQPTDDCTERIIVRLAKRRSATPTAVINALLDADDVPVHVRSLARDDERTVTLFPTNQGETA